MPLKLKKKLTEDSTCPSSSCLFNLKYLVIQRCVKDVEMKLRQKFYNLKNLKLFLRTEIIKKLFLS